MQTLSPDTDLSKLYKQVRSVAFGVARKRLFFLPEWAVWDFAHDASTTVLLNLAQFRGECAFRYWVVRAINNLAINEIIRGRRMRNDVELVAYDDPFWTPIADAIPGNNPSPEHILMRREDVDLVYKLINTDEYMLVDLHCIHEQSMPEIAAKGYVFKEKFTPEQLRSKLRVVRERLIRHGIRKP